MGILRLLFYAVAIWALYRLIQGLRGPARVGGARSGGREPGRVAGGELVQDPQCGVYIPKETAVRGADGTYFCSQACRDAHRRGAP